MDDRLIARLVAAGRVLFGLACIAAPKQILGRFAPEANGPMLWWIRAFGVRDAVLGSGALISLNEDEPDPAWVRFGAIADTGDAAIVLACRKELPPLFTGVTLAIATPAAALGWKASLGLGGRS